MKVLFISLCSFLLRHLFQAAHRWHPRRPKRPPWPWPNQGGRMVRPPGHGHQGGSSADGCQRRMRSRGLIAAPTTVALYPDRTSANGSAVVRIRTNGQASELSPFGNSRFPSSRTNVQYGVQVPGRHSGPKPFQQLSADPAAQQEPAERDLAPHEERRGRHKPTATAAGKSTAAHSDPARAAVPHPENTQNVLLLDQRGMLYE
ncbi:uncharacterized protein LOC119765143 isoform X1 [Culex quinquefasciatus]|uniref:uncharacterized protein LOC119765143 isoform X1 n=1 Tax=Culex quinquefasciatus TaxID=7176 RepID=UPI0018E3C0AF|nr:uncharacterized protein LOC119765143 isoform X1 [Culex quinquefasciatus]